MKVAIHQPNYIPWLGFFSKMRFADVFVFLDDAEVSTGQGYVYRSQVRNDKGEAIWLSVPTSRKLGEPIRTVRFADKKWTRTHVNRLTSYYRESRYCAEIVDLIRPLYAEPGELLADFNIRVIEAIAGALKLGCRFKRSSQLGVHGVRDERLVDLVRIVGGSTYLSGKGGENYQDPARFASADIGLEVLEYKPIPYPQGQSDFIGGLSILDALFHVGPEATRKLLRYPDVSGSATAA
jgi:hypothetical protein